MARHRSPSRTWTKFDSSAGDLSSVSREDRIGGAEDNLKETEEAAVNSCSEDHFSTQMAQRMFHESLQDGRSVLGTLAVQVERDPKTGVSVVRSVTPVSAPGGAPATTTVFDDGRKSIHALGGVESPPTTEELGQILSTIDGVGMSVLLDEVEVTPNKAGTATENDGASKEPERKIMSFSASHATAEEDNMQFDSSRSNNMKAELGVGNCAVSIENKEDRCITAVNNIAGEVDTVVDQQLVDGPVTLLFLGYADDTTDQDADPDNHEGMLTVERVMITEDGEEHVIGPETLPQEDKEPQREGGFRDVPLEGNGAGGQVQREDGEKVQHDSSSPAKAEGEATSKRKTCQCCSVM
ncbi:paralemmin-2-like [Notolabrus celidotus]|uniref:paralemmin-2-like n=1 Tax=Notolabrus celidotus TaxID=1203425 RepID=UPI00148F782C|nr:paralemmin-2-like [Notolabrus celidotus]